jgi:CHAD domain-containing protein
MKALTTYFVTRKKTLLSLLEKSEKKYTPSTFHQLRVELKKLNALFDLIEFSSTKFRRKKVIKPFKTIFKQAGKVRDLQIEEATFKKYQEYNLLLKYRSNLCIQQLKEKKLFFSLLNLQTTKQLKNQYKKSIPFLSEIDREKVNSYLIKKKAEIKIFLSQPNLQTEQLHELRKLLKIYYYNEMNLLLKNKNQKTPKKKKLTELLGNWNDRVITIIQIQKTIDEAKTNTEEIAALESLKIKIAAQNNVFLDKIKLAILEFE